MKHTHASYATDIVMHPSGTQTYSGIQKSGQLQAKQWTDGQGQDVGLGAKGKGGLEIWELQLTDAVCT